MNVFVPTLLVFAGVMALLGLFQWLSGRRPGCQRSLLQTCHGACAGPCRNKGTKGDDDE